MMESEKITEWLSMLGETTSERIRVIQDLIRHAEGDKMTPADFLICRRELARLEGRSWPG